MKIHFGCTLYFFCTAIVDSNIYINIRFCNRMERNQRSVCVMLSAGKLVGSA